MSFNFLSTTFWTLTLISWANKHPAFLRLFLISSFYSSKILKFTPKFSSCLSRENHIWICLPVCHSPVAYPHEKWHSTDLWLRRTMHVIRQFSWWYLAAGLLLGRWWLDSAACVGYSDWLRTGRLRCRSSSPNSVENVHLSISSWLALGRTQSALQRVPGALCPGVRRQGLEAVHWPSPSADVKRAWIFISLSPYVFIV